MRPLDWMFAIALCSLFLGNIVGPLPSMLFIVAVAALACFFVNSRFDFRHFFAAFTLPLMAFTSIHLLSSLANGTDNALTRLLQLGPSYLFSFLLVYQYSRYSLRGMFVAMAILGAAIMVWAVAWHFAQGIYMPLKYFYETKTMFSFIPVALYFALKIRAPAARYGLVIALVALLAMSGERKAYIALALSSVFIFDLRRPGNVLLAAGLALGLVALVQIDSTGYIAQQFGSLFALGEGRVESTVSNLTREWQLQYALRAWEASPIFGIGTNGYLPLVQSQYRSTNANELVILNNVGIHGESLRVLVENGIVGAVAVATLIATALYRIVLRFRSNQDRDGSMAALIIFIALFCYLAFEVFDTNAVVFYALLPNLWRLKMDVAGSGSIADRPKRGASSSKTRVAVLRRRTRVLPGITAS